MLVNYYRKQISEESMEKSFSWQNFDRMAKALESVGYVVAVFGPIIGIALIIFGSSMMQLGGIGLIIASVLIAMYHISFVLLMHGMKDLTDQVEEHVTNAPKHLVDAIGDLSAKVDNLVKNAPKT